MAVSWFWPVGFLPYLLWLVCSCSFLFYRRSRGVNTQFWKLPYFRNWFSELLLQFAKILLIYSFAMRIVFSSDCYWISFSVSFSEGAMKWETVALILGQEVRCSRIISGADDFLFWDDSVQLGLIIRLWRWCNHCFTNVVQCLTGPSLPEMVQCILDH